MRIVTSVSQSHPSIPHNLYISFHITQDFRIQSYVMSVPSLSFIAVCVPPPPEMYNSLCTTFLCVPQNIVIIVVDQAKIYPLRSSNILGAQNISLSFCC